MLSNPTQVNLADYISFLSGVAGIPPPKKPQLVPMFLGVLSGGSTTDAQDSTQTWEIDSWASLTFVDLDQNSSAPVRGNDQVDLEFSRALSSPVLAGDRYFVGVDSIPSSLAAAQLIVNRGIATVGAVAVYVQAVYNLATDMLINFAQDVPGQSFFSDLRTKTYRISDPILGVISSTSDESSSSSYLNPDQMKLLTIANLQNLKTPYGRAYLGYAQSYGRNIWGLT